MSAVTLLLRQQTAASHARVEALTDLLDPDLTGGRLRRVLRRFHGFWAGTEPTLDRWAAASPELASRVDWPTRRRLPHLDADLDALGTEPPDPAPPVFGGVPTDAQALGWLYVSEGSTLGGAVLHRRLAPLTGALALTSFVPYADGPGPRWRAYGALLDDWAAADADRTDAVLAAAADTFAALERYLEPLRDEAAA